MEKITSRKNRIITHLRKLATDSAYRYDCHEYVCDGEKFLHEAVQSGSRIKTVLWGGNVTVELPKDVKQYIAPLDVMRSASPLKNSLGPVFTVAIDETNDNDLVSKILILENVQDPGNVGTVIRTANAMGTHSVILVGDCADLYNPKTVRATMGAIFRQHVSRMTLEQLKDFLNHHSVKLYGAALLDNAKNIQDIDLSKAAVAIGSEGRGLSEEFLSICDDYIIIPMMPQSESLNAAVAASIFMWEMSLT